MILTCGGGGSDEAGMGSQGGEGRGGRGDVRASAQEKIIKCTRRKMRIKIRRTTKRKRSRKKRRKGKSKREGARRKTQQQRINEDGGSRKANFAEKRDLGRHMAREAHNQLYFANVESRRRRQQLLFLFQLRLAPTATTTTNTKMSVLDERRQQLRF